MAEKSRHDGLEDANCGVCGNTSEDEMVQCDDCSIWYHYRCVSATDEVENEEWNCAKCSTMRAAAVSTKVQTSIPISTGTTSKDKRAIQASKRPQVSRDDFYNNGKSSVDIDFELLRLEEERQANLLFIQKKFEILSKNKLCATGSADFGLRAEQVNARHAVPNDLPIFTGKPEEWPAFISSFENSTRICGFSNAENLLRLQHALKGQALSSVSSQLLIPELVPQVIATLKLIFGNPECIINSLLTKIRSSSNVNEKKLESLISFSLEVRNLVATMVACDLKSHLNNPLLLRELIDRLPPQRRLDWALESRKINETNLIHFSDWLFELATAASSVVSFAPVTPREEKKNLFRVGFHEAPTNTPNNKENVRKCIMCHRDHFIAACDQFGELPYTEKWNFIRRMKLCRSCLKVHDLRVCRERKECGVNNCTAKHHRSLHKFDLEKKNNQQVAIQITKTSMILFKILPVTIHGNNGKLDVYALLDDGSGPTMITKNILSQLGLKGKKSQLCIRWTDGSVRVEQNSELLNLKISAKGDNNKRFLLSDVYAVEKLDLPMQTMIIEELENKFTHLKGLPISSYHNVIPNIIIGLNNKHTMMPIKYREGKINEPAASKTRIGWTIFGSLGKENFTPYDKTLQLHVCECDDKMALNRLMIENMKVDSLHQGSRESDQTVTAVEKFESHVERSGESFTAKLFWRSNNLTLPDNFSMAMQRLLCFEKKLNKNHDLKLRVNSLIHEMKKKQYIRKLSDSEIQQYYPRKWYLPIFSVYNPNKPHKTRIVWDAAACYKDSSLNKCLETGPDLLLSLVRVLYNFRIGKIGICGDICEMFHRVKIEETDQHSQRFLWRDCQSEIPPNVYVLQVCSFGATCSPCIAQMAKNKNAREHEKDFPRAAKSILHHHYMDDMLDSADELIEAKKLVTDVSFIHKRGNFEIRNWLSNSSELMQFLNCTQQRDNFCKAAQTLDQVIEPDKVLGLWWQTKNDVFVFNTKFTKASANILNGTKLPTKRELLRLIMSIFDPLGFLSFYTMRIKILLQEIWRSGIEWDDTIPIEFENIWRGWLAMLHKIEKVRVQRCYFVKLNRSDCSVDLHVFVDASDEAYAAVAYLRIESDNRIQVSLIGSKNKVAPIRPISIPRMELSGAVLGARFAKNIIDNHDFKIRSVYYWTDSKTVLCWLREDPRKYKQFVMFRIAEIQEITDISQWLYVPSKQNIADKSTKIKTTVDFEPDNEWFSGPTFLRLPRKDWPQQKGSIKHNDEEKVVNSKIICEFAGLQVGFAQNCIDPARFSKWEYLWRSMAFVRHYLENLRTRAQNRKSDLIRPCNARLTSEELLWAESQLYRLAQSDEYSVEINILKGDPGSVVHKKSPLRKLSAFLDNINVLRCRGRIDNAQVGFNTKNPIILPKSHSITNLIIDWYHRRYHHIHHETVLNEINQKFCIPNLRRKLRSIRSACQVCRNHSVNPVVPEMGQLPAARLSMSTRPFTYTGVDFFGPFLTTVGRRQEKRYGALFTCLTCRAVHIEVAFSLSMNSCMVAIRNFIGRRGTPLEFFSDNGTNFTAAEKELRDAYQQLEIKNVQERLTTSETKWSFIPPASPHMGGAWERMIRSAKNILYKIVTPTTRLNDEKLHNLFIEVEHILNSRPLTHISLEATEQEALTPNHFLLGTSNGSKPPGLFDTTDQYTRSSWRHSQYLAECFWKRWMTEVLPILTHRTKWHDKVKPIKCGDVVLIVDPNLPRYTWPKGIVKNVVLAKDGQVRSVFVRTASGEYHRPTAKIAVLDVLPKSNGDVATNVLTNEVVEPGRRMLATSD